MFLSFQRNKVLIIPHNFLTIVSLIGVFIYGIYNTFSHGQVLFHLMFGTIILIAFRVYSWFWVYSLYIEIRDDDLNASNTIGMDKKKIAQKPADDNSAPYNTLA